MADSFPRQKARTRNFTLGAPRSFEVAADGSRVVFLRSPAGDDPQTALWVFDMARGQERLVVDPGRSSVRAAGGAVGRGACATRADARDRRRDRVLRDRPQRADRRARLIRQAACRRSGPGWGDGSWTVPTPVFDPRPDPSGRRVAFVHERALHVVGLADGAVTRLAGEDDGRQLGRRGVRRGRGDGPRSRLLVVAGRRSVAVGSGRRVRRCHGCGSPMPPIPASPPRAVRYPRPGSANAAVEAYVLRLDGAAGSGRDWDGRRTRISPPRTGTSTGRCSSVQTRDQRRARVLAVDPRAGRPRC